MDFIRKLIFIICSSAVLQGCTTKEIASFLWSPLSIKNIFVIGEEYVEGGIKKLKNSSREEEKKNMASRGYPNYFSIHLEKKGRNNGDMFFAFNDGRHGISLHGLYVEETKNELWVLHYSERSGLDKKDIYYLREIDDGELVLTKNEGCEGFSWDKGFYDIDEALSCFN